MCTRLNGAGDEPAEISKEERERSMSGKGREGQKSSYARKVSARRAWRKLNCLNPSLQGVILHDGVAMIDTPYRIEGSGATRRSRSNRRGLPSIGGIKGTNGAPSHAATPSLRKHGIA